MITRLSTQLNSTQLNWDNIIKSVRKFYNFHINMDINSDILDIVGYCWFGVTAIVIATSLVGILYVYVSGYRYHPAIRTRGWHLILFTTAVGCQFNCLWCFLVFFFLQTNTQKKLETLSTKHKKVERIFMISQRVLSTGIVHSWVSLCIYSISLFSLLTVYLVRFDHCFRGWKCFFALKKRKKQSIRKMLRQNKTRPFFFVGVATINIKFGKTEHGCYITTTICH